MPIFQCSCSWLLCFLLSVQLVSFMFHWYQIRFPDFWQPTSHAWRIQPVFIMSIDCWWSNRTPHQVRVAKNHSFWYARVKTSGIKTSGISAVIFCFFFTPQMFNVIRVHFYHTTPCILLCVCFRVSTAETAISYSVHYTRFENCQGIYQTV